MRRRQLALAAAAALATSLTLTIPATALAQTAWPSQPVKIVVPTGPGSSLDLIVRLMSDKLAARWSQPVVVDNKPGAGGMLGIDIAAKATDGHTLAIGFNGPLAYAPYLYAKTPYDPVKDLKPIVMTTSQANVLAVNAEKVPAKTLGEFVAWAKAQGGKFNYSSLGQGSSAHLTMELFLAEVGAQGVHVPFNGSPPAAMAVAQGHGRRHLDGGARLAAACAVGQGAPAGHQRQGQARGPGPVAFDGRGRLSQGGGAGLERPGRPGQPERCGGGARQCRCE